MGRRWLGVSKRDYVRMPHADSWPESLWWFVLRPGESTADRQAVLDAYLKQYGRGKTVPDGFYNELITFLQELTHEQNLKPWGKPRTKRYWTIPDYARANGIRPHTLMKRVREMENIAKEMFPARAKHYGRRTASVSESEKEAIIKEFWKGTDIKDISKQHGLTPAHIGIICADAKDLKRAVQRGQLF